MSDEMICPRRAEGALLRGLPEHDHWREDNSCSFCGCFNPDTFMERLEARDIELGPTDKNYKVYVRNLGGEMFKQSYRDCPRHEPQHGPDECEHWVTREQSQTKFYFQHLSIEQKKRFVELLNEKLLHIGMPGHFYTRPFFIAPPIKG